MKTNDWNIFYFCMGFIALSCLLIIYLTIKHRKGRETPMKEKKLMLYADYEPQEIANIQMIVNRELEDYLAQNHHGFQYYIRRSNGIQQPARDSLKPARDSLKVDLNIGMDIYMSYKEFHITENPNLSKPYKDGYDQINLEIVRHLSVFLRMNFPWDTLSENAKNYIKLSLRFLKLQEIIVRINIMSKGFRSLKEEITFLGLFWNYRYYPSQDLAKMINTMLLLDPIFSNKSLHGTISDYEDKMVEFVNSYFKVKRKCNRIKVLKEDLYSVSDIPNPEFDKLLKRLLSYAELYLDYMGVKNPTDKYTLEDLKRDMAEEKEEKEDKFFMN